MSGLRRSASFTLGRQMAKMELERPTSDSEDEAQGPPLLACRVDFEATGPRERLEALRKLHSEAVRRRYALLPFFQQVQFDQGPQGHSGALG